MADQIDFNELKQKLEDIFEENSRWYSMGDFLGGDFDEDVAKAAGVVHIEQDGGGEGGSEDCYAIFSIGDMTYKVTYNYYSHHGYELQYAHAYVVTPIQKLVTVYE